MGTTYSISDLASEFDVTTRTIRFYEEKGLLSPRREGHARLFDKADRVRLKLILRGKRLGLSLEDSREIIAMYEPRGSNRAQLQRLIEKIQDKRRDLQRQHDDLNLMLADLAGAEERLQQELADMSPTKETL